ncbi:hypothetical protein [Pontibacter chitinilyticus]|uniref:hypothetical protein n=1 Tax=Pontibacter chitinilyticus TaxID=2674989 RepID=UPI00321B5F62
MKNFAIAIHAGAEKMKREDVTPEEEQAYREGLGCAAPGRQRAGCCMKRAYRKGEAAPYIALWEDEEAEK